MESIRTLLAIDFGSEYIRVEQTHYDPSRPLGLNPQPIEFSESEKGYLRNAVLFTSRLDNILAVGRAAYKLDESATDKGLGVSGLSLGAEQDNARSQLAIRALLDKIVHSVALDRLSQEGKQEWATLVATPISGSPDLGAKMVERLKQAGLPSPQACASVLAILRFYFPMQLPQGLYLIVDCGARETRFALCQVVTPDDILLLAEKLGSPGGNDFDRVLIEHFRSVLTQTTVLSPENQSELRQFVHGFKVRFLNAMAKGETSLVSLYSVEATKVKLQLAKDELYQSLARILIADFRCLGQQILDENNVPGSSLQGILIAGGNAYWPFVREWAERVVGPGKIFEASFPEEVIVKGILYLADGRMRIRRLTDISEPPPTTAPPTVEPVKPKQPYVSPWLALSLEFVCGLLGVLGVGWFFVLHNMIGCAALIGWWVVLIATVIILGGFSALTLNPAPLLIFVPIYLLVPSISAVLAYLSAKQHNQNL